MKFYASHPGITSAWVREALMYSSPVNQCELTNWQRVSFGGLKNGLHVLCTGQALLPYRCYAVIENPPEIDKRLHWITSPERTACLNKVDRALKQFHPMMSKPVILGRCYCSGIRQRWSSAISLVVYVLTAGPLYLEFKPRRRDPKTAGKNSFGKVFWSLLQRFR